MNIDNRILVVGSGIICIITNEKGILMNSNEYLMLRNEILHLDTIINNTINFFYVFVSAVVLFALKQEDSTAILVTYIVIIPAYLIVLSKEIGIYKIAAYLYVFHEGKDFNWERRRKIMNEDSKILSVKVIQAFNYPFLFVSTVVTVLFMIKTQWCEIGLTEEFIKVFGAFVLYLAQLILIFSNKRIGINKYIPVWETVKNEE